MLRSTWRTVVSIWLYCCWLDEFDIISSVDILTWGKWGGSWPGHTPRKGWESIFSCTHLLYIPGPWCAQTMMKWFIVWRPVSHSGSSMKVLRCSRKAQCSVAQLTVLRQAINSENGKRNNHKVWKYSYLVLQFHKDNKVGRDPHSLIFSPLKGKLTVQNVWQPKKSVSYQASVSPQSSEGVSLSWGNRLWFESHNL